MTLSLTLTHTYDRNGSQGNVRGETSRKGPDPVSLWSKTCKRLRINRNKMNYRQTTAKTAGVAWSLSVSLFIVTLDTVLCYDREQQTRTDDNDRKCTSVISRLLVKKSHSDEWMKTLAGCLECERRYAYIAKWRTCECRWQSSRV